MKAHEVARRRGIVPGLTGDSSVASLSTTFETSYRLSYVKDGASPLRGEACPRPHKLPEQVGQLLSISNTTMADAATVQSTEYRNPSHVLADCEPKTRLGKISQPKPVPFRPTPLTALQPRCV